MMNSIANSTTQCQLVEWIQIGVLIGIGLFSLTFLTLGMGVLARYLFDRRSDRRAGTA